MHRPGMLSIWFFIGVLLLVYGVLILGAGCTNGRRLHRNTPWCWRTCTRISGGARCMLILGAFYTIKFRPGRGNSR